MTAVDDRQRMAQALGEQVRKARERRGLSPEEVAQVLAAGPHSVASWEAGLRVPRLDSLGRLATLLEVGLGDLTGLFPVGGPGGPPKHRFGEALQAARKRKGWSAGVAARTLGVSEAALARWEEGKGIPETSRLPRLAQALGWHLGELDGIVGAPVAPPAPAGEGAGGGEDDQDHPVAAAMGALLRSRREQRGWSRVKVCRRAGINESSLRGYECGVNAPGSETLGRLAHALELDLGDFAEALNPWSAARRRWDHLGRALRLVRERRGWSREQLAERARGKVALVKRWEEKERKAPRMTTVGPIVEALGIGLGELDGVFGPELPRANRFEQLGRAIGVIRGSRGLDRDALARRSGVAQTAIARWEGGAVPSLGNFAQVAGVLELDLGDLGAALDEAVAQARSSWAALSRASPIVKLVVSSMLFEVSACD
jgi:transcriptional regulator with XRE-family HTH domain